MGGKTVDNIESLDILLYDGTRLTVGPTSEAELQSIIAGGGRHGEIYAGLARIRDTYSDLVRRRFPKIPRRVSGYNLDELLPENGFNVARALVGSEGTCVTVLQSRCTLMHSPQHRRLVVLGFDDAFIAADYVPRVLEYKPIGLEGFDGLMVDYMLRKHLAVDDVLLLPEGRGFLLCEFGEDSAEAADATAEKFTQAALSFGKTCTVRRYSDAEAKRVWKVRDPPWELRSSCPEKSMDGRAGRIPRCRPEQLGSYLRELNRLLWKVMATRLPCTDTSARAAYTCASPLTSKARKALRSFASLSTRLRISSWLTADLYPANTAMGRLEGLCSRKCTARS